MRALLAAALLIGLTACAGVPKKAAPPAASTPASPAHASGKKKSPYAAAQEDPSKRGDYVAGGLYAPNVRDSVPEDLPDVDAIPEPEVTNEPRSVVGNRKTYTVLGKNYHVLDNVKGYVETGVASYYGKKFHGRRTSNLEVYDMYAFSAAHRTLPLPSFARVTNLDNGKSVIVRVNDRGPFHAGRLIDLSYAAAAKLGYVRNGTARVEVRALLPDDASEPRASDTAVAARDAGQANKNGDGDRERRGQGKSPGKSAADTSAMDKLVAAIPVATAAAADTPGRRTVAAATDYRFDMRQDGRAMSADEFDAWMKARQLRVASGKPGVPVPRGETRGASESAVPAAAPPPPPPREAAAVVAATTANADDVVLQIAAFAARDNADRALAIVRDAGIREARLVGSETNGQKVWRLRVGPLTAATAPELAARLVGLGFGQPQRVRE